MRLLLDTNVVILANPLGMTPLDPQARVAVELIRMAQERGHQLLVHPLIRVDLSRDDSPMRQQLTAVIAGSYARVQNHPPISDRIKDIVGTALPESNDWVDDHLIAAVNEGAADVLITEDRKLRRKAERPGLIGERVMTMAGALETLRVLSEVSPRTNPSVRRTSANNLNAQDPIFTTIRAEYTGFDTWFAKAQSAGRTAWVVEEGTYLAAVAIIKAEIPAEYGPEGRGLKISTFKVAEAHRGSRFGELLLKEVLAYGLENDYDWVYFTAWPSNEAIIDFSEQFGFQFVGRAGEELVMAKPLAPGLPGDASLTNLEYSIRYGPHQYRTAGANGFIVPIQPHYFHKLFPDADMQGRLFPNIRPYANAIRKAYICNTGNRQLTSGDLLYFYRSGQNAGVMAVGVVEETLVSSSPGSVAGFVGQRTVYSLNEIEEICTSEALAILFRQARLLSNPVFFEAMLHQGILKGPPQSIQSLSKEGIEWLESRIRSF